LDLFRYRSFATGVACLLFFFGVHNSFLLVCAVYLQESLHFTPLAASLYFVPMGLSFLGGSYWASRRVAAWGIRLLQMGALMMLGSFALQVVWLGGGQIGAPLIVALFCIYGWGWGQVLPSLLNVSLKDIPGEYAGGASGVYSTVQQFSSALGVSIIGGVYFAASGGLGYGGAYKTATCCMIAYVLAGLVLLERLRRGQGVAGAVDAAVGSQHPGGNPAGRSAHGARAEPRT
jgi:predicted MFS family arabinose efflux permease